MTFIQAMERRTSCRTYRPTPLDPETIERLTQALDTDLERWTELAERE
jgi:nitroreductase